MQTEQTQQPPQEQPPSLQLADLVLVLKLIQETSRRGAIRPEEMAEVGAVYDKLVKFLVASGALQAPKPAGEPEENQNG
jgi:hypothetical protein